MTLDVAWAVDWVRRSAQTVAEHRDELIELDRQIGDGDHGENLDRGFSAVVAKLDALAAEPADIGDVLKLVATTLMSTVGGAAGPLYGTAFLRAAKATGVAAARRRGRGRAARGRARRHRRPRQGRRSGEKTMVDAWTPAVEAAVAAADGGSVAGARCSPPRPTPRDAGAEATDPAASRRKGRASYLGSGPPGTATRARGRPR